MLRKLNGSSNPMGSLFSILSGGRRNERGRDDSFIGNLKFAILKNFYFYFVSRIRREDFPGWKESIARGRHACTYL